MSLSSEGQSLSANQILSTYLNCPLIYNYFRFWKINVRHIVNLLSVSILTICLKSAHYSASGYRISSKSKHLLRKYDVISIYQDGSRNGWIRFPVSYMLMSLPSEGQSLLANQILSRYLKWRLRYMSAILELYFWFRSRSVRRNLHVILHQATELPPNRNTHCGNMTSYLILKMAAATAKYYFRFPICWCNCVRKVKVYQQTKFLRDITIGGWDITTSSFDIQTSAIWEFYFRFRSRPVRRNLHVILHQATEFRPNRSTHCGNMTSYPFFKMAAATAKYYFRFRICWCHCL